MFKDAGKWGALIKSGKFYNELISLPENGITHVTNILDGVTFNEDNSEILEKNSVLKAILQPSRLLYDLLDEDYIE